MCNLWTRKSRQVGSIKASRIFREAHENLVEPGLGAGSWAGLGQDQEQLITHLSETGRRADTRWKKRKSWFCTLAWDCKALGLEQSPEVWSGTACPIVEPRLYLGAHRKGGGGSWRIGGTGSMGEGNGPAVPWRWETMKCVHQLVRCVWLDHR